MVMNVTDGGDLGGACLGGRKKIGMVLSKTQD